MAACNFDAPNGQTSLLFTQLETRIGTERATQIWHEIRSQQFGQRHFGGWAYQNLVDALRGQSPEDWLERLRNIMQEDFGVPTDANGEPTANWVADRFGINLAEPEAPRPQGGTRRPITTQYGVQDLFGQGSRDERISFEAALDRVRAMYEDARNNPDLSIDLTAIPASPISRPTRSGFTPVELANLFASLPIPANVRFNEAFEGLIVNTASFQLQALDIQEANLLQYNVEQVQAVVDEIKIPILDNAGNPTGETFTAEQQVAVVDTIVALTWEVMSEQARTGQISGEVGLRPADFNIGGRIYNRLVQKYQMLDAEENISEDLTAEEIDERLDNLERVLVGATWEAFVKRSIYRLESYGLKLRDANAINQMFRSDRGTEYSTPAVGQDTEDAATMLTEGEGGRGLESWYDSSFELDPRDTASARIKLFLASIKRTHIGPERRPPMKVLRFSDPAVRERFFGIGRPKTFTIRKPDVLENLRIELGEEYVTPIINPDNPTAAPTLFRATFERRLTEKDLEDTDIQAEANEEGITPEVGDVLVRMVRYTPQERKLQPRENFIGFAELVDFESLFQELLEITSELATPTFENMLAAIEAEARNFRPDLGEVATRLKAAPEQLQKEFVKVATKQYQEFTITLRSKTRGGMIRVNNINANSGAAVNSIVKQWQENQKNASVITKDAAGNMIIDQTVVAPFATALQNINTYLAVYQEDQVPEHDILRPLAAEILEANGIVMPDGALDYLFDHITTLTKGTSFSGGAHKQFAMTADGKPQGIFSAIIAKLAGAVEETDVSEDEYLLNNNPLYTEQTAMRLLARIAYKFSPRTAAGSHKNSEGKSIYSFGMRTHLSSTMMRLRERGKEGQGLRDLLLETHLGRHNWLLKQIDTGQLKEEFGLRYVDGLKDADKASAQGITRPNMSSREQLLFAMGQFMNGGNPTMNLLSLTHSDKTTTPLFSGILRFKSQMSSSPAFIGGTLDVSLTHDQTEALFDTFRGEYDRIVDWQGRRDRDEDGNWVGPLTKNDSFNKGGGLFYFIPHLNRDNMLRLAGKQGGGFISDNERRLIWNDDGTINTHLDVVKAKKLVKKIFEQEFLKPEIMELRGRFREEEFYDKGLIDERYMFKNLFEAGLIRVKGTGFGRNRTPDAYHLKGGQRGQLGLRIGTSDDMTPVMEHMLTFAAKDFVINNFLFHTAMTGMVFGDPALTYKPAATSKLDFQKVEDSMKEYQKRLAKDIAPGQDPAWLNGPEETYRTITILDDERVHGYLEHMEKYTGAKINGSDAQEVTTVREHLYVMYSMGLVNGQVYREMIAIIDAAIADESNTDNYYEFTDDRHLDVVMQIMKPVSVSHSFHEVLGTSTVQYVKSSAMPLYPPLTRYFQIDHLRVAMEGNGKDTHIPRANYISAKKVGAPLVNNIVDNRPKAGKGIRIFDDNGDMLPIDTQSEAWIQGTQVLSRSGFRIQQEVPYDELKDEILTGSQMNKLFTQGAENLQSITVRGIGTITGRELKEMKEEVRKQMVAQQLAAFEEEVGVDENGRANKMLLLQALEREALSRNYPPNDLLMIQRQVDRIMENGTTIRDLAIPLFFNPSASRFESLLMSRIKKIGKVYMPGKSFIQASSAGFKLKGSMTMDELTDDDRSGIVWVKNEDGSFPYDGRDLKTMTKTTVNGREVTEPAQVLLPFNFLVNGEKVDVKDFMITDDKGRKILDMNRVPKELIEIIGFRIPTQKHNSMLPIQVVGFVPANLGDIIVVPAAITMQMGSDFDVDKLFVYRRPYKAIGGKRNGDPLRFVPTDDEAQTRFNQRAFFIGRGLGEQVEATEEAIATAQTRLEEGRNPQEIQQLRADMEAYVEENSTPSMDQLTTRYFDLAWAVLTHPEMYETVMSPLDKPDLKKERDRALASRTPKPESFFSIVRQLDDFLSQKDAKVMVGISSLSVVFTAGIEDMNLRVERFREEDEETEEGTTSRRVPVPNGIRFIAEDDEVGEAPRQAYMISGAGTAKYWFHGDKEADVEWRWNAEAARMEQMLVSIEDGKVLGPISEGRYEERTKLDDQTSLQSEFLDHSKNRTIDPLNINLSTVYAALGMSTLSDDTGTKPGLKHLALFLRQPIILELVKQLARSQDSLSDVFTPDALNTLGRELMAQYRGMLIAVDPAAQAIEAFDQMLEDENYDVIDLERMKENLDERMTDPEWLMHQMGMLKAFMHLNAIGRELGTIQRVFSQDPKGPGKNMIQALDTINQRRDISGPLSLIRGADALFNTEMGYIHRTELDTARDAYTEVLPYQGLLPIIDRFKEISRRQKLTTDAQQELVEGFKSFIFSDPALGLSSNPIHDRYRLLYGVPERDGRRAEKSLAARVWEAQNNTEWGRRNYFLNRLQPQQADIPNTPSYVFYLASRASALDDQENTAAFLELLVSEDETQRRLAEDLVRYAYVTGGIGGSFSFIRYIPADYLIALPFAARLREVNDLLANVDPGGGSHWNTDDFIRQYIQHNPATQPKIELSMVEPFGITSISERFELPSPSPAVMQTPLGKLIAPPETPGGLPLYPDYLAYFDKADSKWKLFEKYGSVEYRRVDTLGNSYVKEYHNTAPLTRSALAENRALIRPGSFRPAIEHVVAEQLIRSSIKGETVGRYGLKQGKSLKDAEVNHLFKKIRDDKAQPQSNRILAEVLDEILYAVRSAQPVSVKIGSVDAKGKETNPGIANPAGEITLFMEHKLKKGEVGMSDPTFFAQVLNHEAIHVLTYPFTRMSIAERAALPEADAAFQGVREVYNEAKQAILNAAAEAGFSEDLLNRMLAGTTPAPGPAKKWLDLLYTVSSMDEFITSVFTKQDLQKFLNETATEIEDTTLLGRLMKFFSDFLKALAKELGIDIKQGHLLEVSLRRSIKFLEEAERAKATRPDPDSHALKLVQDYAPDGVVETEAQAQAIVEKFNEDYDSITATAVYNDRDGVWNIQLDMSNFSGFDMASLFAVDDENTIVVTNPIDKVHGKVLEQIKAISASLAKDTKDAAIMRQQYLLKELKILAQDLKANADFETVATMAKYQLKWATRIADQYQNEGLPVSINEIMTASRLTSLWTDVINLIYGGSDSTDAVIADEELSKLEADAKLLQSRFNGHIMRDVFKKIAAAEGRELKTEDFDNITDMAAYMGALDVARAKEKLVSEVGTLVQNTHRNYLEEGDRLMKRIGAFEAKAREVAAAKGMKPEELYKLMFQEGTHWGLVSRYSSAFYKWRAGRKAVLEEKIRQINEEATIGGGTDADRDIRRAMRIKEAYASYWRTLKKKAGYIDVRVLFDDKGELKVNPTTDKYYNDRIDEYGKKLTDELILEAQAKFKQYLQDKQDTFDMYDAQEANGFWTATEVIDAKGAWDLENSPVYKLATHEKVHSIKHTSLSDKYLILVPHADATDGHGNSFFDSKFGQIQGDSKLQELYEEVKGFMDEFTSNLPYYLDSKLGPNFLPAIKNKLVAEISNVVPYIKSLKAKAIDALTATSYEEFMQQRAHKDIPIMYTEDPLSGISKPDLTDMTPEQRKAAMAEYEKKKVERLNGYTKDLPRILELFGLMSTHFKHFSDAKDAIDMGKTLIETADAALRNGQRQVEHNGKKITVQADLRNTLDNINYAIDALMYKRTKDLEGKLGTLNFKKDKEKVEKKVKELKAEVEDLKKALKNNEITKDEYDTKMKAINEELDKFDVRTLYASKVGDVLITWTQLKALSYNPISAVNNMLFGLISSQVHANGGQDFTNKDFRKAFSIMMNSTGRSLRLSRITGKDSNMHKTATKILALMDRMGIMGELNDSDYGESNLKEKRGWKQTLSPYQMLRTGDYFVKGLNMVAVMLNQTVIDPATGQSISVWEAFNDDGTFKYQDTEWQSEDVRDQKKFQRLKNKIVAVNKIVMGNQDKSSPIFAKKHILFRLIGQFRLSWFAEGIANRFEEYNEHDPQLGRARKGRYRTYADLGFVGSVTMLAKQAASAIPGVSIDPYKNARFTNGKEMTELDVANMRRNIAEIAWFLLLFGTAFGIAQLAAGDDDENRKKWYKFWMNMATRSYQDISLYGNPTTMDMVLGTTAPALTTIRDVQKFISATGKLMWDDDYTYEQWLLRFTKAGFIPQTTLINRYKTMTEKDISELAR